MFSLQVSCVANYFEQPLDAAVAQEEEASPTSLHENTTTSLNHYGSTDWRRIICVSL